MYQLYFGTHSVSSSSLVGAMVVFWIVAMRTPLCLWCPDP